MLPDRTLVLVELLLRKGADVNARIDGGYGWTPLHAAVYSGHREVAKFLIASGADINAKDIFGLTPLHGPALSGRKEAVDLLIANGADINAKDGTERTPLHWATVNGQKEFVELLIAKGADINLKDAYGKSALQLAIDWKYGAVAEVLRKAGAKE